MRTQTRLVSLAATLLTCWCIVPEALAAPAHPALAIRAQPPRESSNAAKLAIAEGPRRATEPAFSLTSPDGAGLQLQRVEVRVSIDGPLAWTELWLTFHNPEARIREGRFSITLPADAALGRFAMQIGDHWMDGEVVEKHQAEVAYDDFLHARQDPAILTRDAGNVFSARVFPIAASADKRLVVAWSQPLPDPELPLVVPLHGLPQVPELVLHAWADGKTLADSTLRNVSPQHDLQLFAQSAGAVRSGKLVAARVRIDSASAADPMPKLAVLIDTSASAAPAFAARLQALSDVVALARSQGTAELWIAAFDQSQVEIFRGSPGGFGAPELERLRARRALGATDLGAALDFAKAKGPAGARWVLISDAMATAGEASSGKLLSRLQSPRLDVVLPAGARDEAMARALAAAGHGTVVRAEQGQWQRLARAVLPPISLEAPGAVALWPKRVAGLQPGDAFLVTAEIEGDLVLRLSGGADGEVRAKPQAGDEALLGRALAGAHIEQLEAQLAEKDDAKLAAQLVAVSVGQRVLSSKTAFLVLETEQDYARYHIDRKNPVPLLAVGADGRVVAAKRGDPALVLKEVPPAESREEEEKVQYVQQHTGGGERATPSRSGSGRAAASVKMSVGFGDGGGGAGEVVAKTFDSGPSGDGKAEDGVSVGFGDGKRRFEQASVEGRRNTGPEVQLLFNEVQPVDGDAAGVRAEVAKIAARKNSAMQRCVLTAAKDNPDVGGKYVVAFTVGTEGTVTDVAVSGAGGPLADCFKGKFMAIRGLPQLPAPQKFRASYAFSYTPGHVETPAERAERVRDEARRRREEARRQREAEAEARRQEIADRLEAQKEHAADVAAFRKLWNLRTNLAGCMGSERQMVVEVEISDRGLMRVSLVDGVSPAVEACVHKRIERGRNLDNDPPSDQTWTKRIGIVRDSGSVLAFPTPEGLDRAWRREQKGDGERDYDSEDQCRLGPSRDELARVLAEQQGIELQMLPDPAALRFERLASQLAGGQRAAVREAAWKWHEAEPGEILPLVLLGQAAQGDDRELAARAFGSLIDLHPARADLRRFAGNLLESTGAQALALDTYAAAARLRPDHVSGYPQHALALARAGKYAQAMEIVEASLDAERRNDAARMSDAVARDLLGLLAAAWRAHDKDAPVAGRLTKAGAAMPTGSALRFLLTWETDANDVDFHVRDHRKGHACFSAMQLPSGGELFEDVTTGYGPEWFAIDAPKAFPYKLDAHYFARGPMGFGMGRVLVVRWNGRGLSFEDRPFVITRDDETARLGMIR